MTNTDPNLQLSDAANEFLQSLPQEILEHHIDQEGNATPHALKTILENAVDPPDNIVHNIFLQELDFIIENAIDFIKDDGPEESLPYINDLAAALHLKQIYIDLHNIDKDNSPS